MEFRFVDNKIVLVKDGQTIEIDEDGLEDLVRYAKLVYKWEDLR